MPLLGAKLIATATLLIALIRPCGAVDLKIDEIIFATSIPYTQQNATLNAICAFYQFWNTGDDSLLKEARAPNFADRTLLAGRPQGPQGPAFASRQFRGAVPDLGVEVKKMIVASDYVTVPMVFTGHFTGRFGQTEGRGQFVNLIATDLLCGAVLFANMLLLAVGAIWLVHIGADRALGYGLKYATGFGDTHLSDSS